MISHTYPDGKEKPIAYTSLKLTKAEKNYARKELCPDSKRGAGYSLWGPKVQAVSVGKEIQVTY